MDITPNEAEEALAAIDGTARKARHAFATSGAYVFLLFSGAIWLVGFLSTQFLSAGVAAWIWVGASVAGSALAVLVGARMGRRVREPSAGLYGRRLGLLWLFLALFAVAAIAVAHPANGKQLTMLVILFIMLGQLSMGLLLSFSATWWALPVTAVALAGYFLLPDIFYLWMAVLGGGGMIALALYIRSRW